MPKHLLLITGALAICLNLFNLYHVQTLTPGASVLRSNIFMKNQLAATSGSLPKPSGINTQGTILTTPFSENSAAIKEAPTLLLCSTRVPGNKPPSPALPFNHLIIQSSESRTHGPS
jgi:hypothetical protein